MVFLAAFVLIVMAVCALTVWSHVGREPAAARPWRAAMPDGPASPEGVLTAQLAAGDISHRQYVRAMERLAASEEQRHPLAVPPEKG